MKYYNFLPGFILVGIFVFLMVLQNVFNVDIPVIKNFKRPFLVFFIAGLMLCAFGTIGHSFSNFIRNGSVDWFVVAMILVGILIVFTGLAALLGKTPVMGFITKQSAFSIISVMIVIKIILATIRIIRFS